MESRANLKRRSGTGRITTQRQRLDFGQSVGARTGIKLNSDNIQKFDGYDLPGSYFDQVHLVDENDEHKPYDSLTSSESETEPVQKYFTPEKPTIDIQSITPIKKVSEKKNQSISFEDTPQYDLGGGDESNDEELFVAPVPQLKKVNQSPKHVSINNSVSSVASSPNRHIRLEDMTPIKYTEDFVDTPDKTFQPQQEEEDSEEELEPETKLELKRSTRAHMKPVEFWKNEAAEYQDDAIIGKKRQRTPKPPKSKPKKVASLPPDFGSFPVVSGSKIVSQQILQTRDTCVEERFKLVSDDNDDDAKVDIGIRVAFSNDRLKSGVIEVHPESSKPLQNSKDYYEVFYCLGGKAIVTIHESSFGVSSGSHFMIPPHNNFSIVNESSRDICKFCYFMTKVE
jgi:mannose-6-phosphate isomerase-like protein (cupin superfamily)